VRVTPRAGRTSIAGVRDGALIVRVAAPPVVGAANSALVDALADAFHLPRRAISIVPGERSRTKRVSFGGIAPDTLDARLAAILGQ